MAITTGILPAGLNDSPTRAPLQPRKLSPSSTSSLKQVRRMDSFMRRVDSSEDYPSTHDSIFEAFYFSGSNSDESNNRIELISIPPRNEGVPANNENREPSSSQTKILVNDVQFLYGHGTPLDTITEQRSFATMRTVSRTKSADDIPNFPFLNHRDSFVLSKTPRRKQSFSLDLALMNRYYHEACYNIERKECKPLLEVTEVYAEPMKPLHAPPERPDTPPGMPSWTAAQTAGPRVQPAMHHTSGQPNRFRRLFGFSSSGHVIYSMMNPQPTPGPSGQRVLSLPVRGRVAPKFRPPRSAYGQIDQHPFSRAPVAKVANQLPQLSSPVPANSPPARTSTRPPTAQPEPIERSKSRGARRLGLKVRFTPSATARDSEALALQAAIESTSTAAVHPLAPMEAIPQVPHLLPDTYFCHHRGGHRKSLITSQNTTPSSFNYENLPYTPPPHLRPMEPRHFLDPLTPSEPLDFTSSSPSLASLSLGSSLPGIPSLGLPSLGSQSHSLTESFVTADSTLSEIPPVASRISSVSSTAHLMSGQLMSGALRSTNNSLSASIPEQLRSVRMDTRLAAAKERAPFCWKCKAENTLEALDRLWIESLGFLCFICCGFEVEEERSETGSTSVAFSDNGASFNPFTSGLRGGAGTSGHLRAPRKVVLEQKPVVTF